MGAELRSLSRSLGQLLEDLGLELSSQNCSEEQGCVLLEREEC